MRSVVTTAVRGNGGSEAIRALATVSWKARKSSEIRHVSSSASIAAWTTSTGVGSVM